ncbi:MAG TPA: DNA methyltransferase [Myxococcales bacterium]|jgi:adenine-specific DNA-methyltransferase
MSRRAADQNRPLVFAPELVWPGKRGGTPARPGAAALEPEELLPPEAPARPAWRNRLIQGDNLAALACLRGELAGKVDLIYIDPPFATGLDWDYRPEVGERQSSAQQARRLSATAYRDGWGPHKSAWFTMMADRLRVARELLSEQGTLYVHVDWNAGHHLRVLLDEIFGADNSLGEIVWAYGSPSGGRAAGKKLVKSHDFILAFAKSYGQQKYHPVWLPYSERYLSDWFKFKEADGRRYRKRWRRAKDGTSFFEKQYLDESKGVPASTVWTDVQQVYADPRAYKAGMASEITGYPTQKPLKLLERILAISTAPGDLVLDFFAGSGTTLVAAEKTGRRWIGCDQNPQATQLAARRLLSLPEARPFSLDRISGEPPAAFEDPPSVRLERKDGKVRLHLESPAPGWEEKLERWSVGKLKRGALAAGWTAFRTQKARALPLESPWLDLAGEVSVQVVDLLGRSARIAPK